MRLFCRIVFGVAFLPLSATAQDGTAAITGEVVYFGGGKLADAKAELRPEGSDVLSTRVLHSQIEPFAPPQVPKILRRLWCSLAAFVRLPVRLFRSPSEGISWRYTDIHS